MRLVKFNESDNFFRIKNILTDINNILVDFRDEEIKYRLFPDENDLIKVKVLSLDQLPNYDDFYLKIFDIPNHKKHFELIKDKVEMIVDYMSSERFDTNIIIKLKENNFKKRNDEKVINIDELDKYLPTTFYIKLDFIKQDKYVYESLPHDKSIDQLKKVMKISKKTDIGNRISDMNKQGANIDYIQNPIDSGIESYEDYEKHNKKFVPSWNLKHLVGPFHPEPKPKVKFKQDYKQNQDKIKK